MGKLTSHLCSVVGIAISPGFRTTHRPVRDPPVHLFASSVPWRDHQGIFVFLLWASDRRASVDFLDMPSVSDHPVPDRGHPSQVKMLEKFRILEDIEPP